MKKINLTKPSIDQKEINAVQEVFKSGWLIRGTQTQLFEQEFARFLGAKYGVATNGCTMALYLGLKHLNLKTSDEVIVPSFTWSATASVVIQAGATPVFADIKKEDWCLDPEDVRKKITKNTKLIIPVHYAARFATGFEKFEIPIMYDSAHRVEKGDFKGVTSCYSFYAVKNMTTIRGGMILTNDEKAAQWYRMACHGGLAQDTLSRYQGGNALSVSSFYYEVEVPGWNFDMTDIEAAVGREQLKKIEQLDEKRNKVVSAYNRGFELNNSGNHLYPILVENRDEFLLNMRESGVQCSIHYLPLHKMKGYRYLKTEDLPVTEFVGKHCVSLPLHASLTHEEIDYVISRTKKFGKLMK